MKQTKKRRRPSGIVSTILNLVMLIPTFYSLTGKVLSLAGYEARLAGRSIMKILLLAVLSTIVLMSTWFCLLALLGMYLVSIGLSYVLTLVAIVSLNIFLLLILLILSQRSERNLSFSATRRQLQIAFHRLKEE